MQGRAGPKASPRTRSRDPRTLLPVAVGEDLDFEVRGPLAHALDQPETVREQGAVLGFATAAGFGGELTEAVAQLVERLREPRLAVSEVEYHGSFLIRGPAKLPLEFKPRIAA